MTDDRRHWWPAYIGIGSNLDEPVAQVSQALDELAALPESRLTARSGLYRSAAVGPSQQPDFINAAAALLTQLPAVALLTELQRLEDLHHRRRDVPRWGPRTLDLDLLVYGTETSSGTALCLPHPRIAERNFVLLPLLEIAPQLQVPGLASVVMLARDVVGREPRIERLEQPS